MKKFEYRAENLLYQFPRLWIDRLNELGAEGWEIVEVFEDSGGERSLALLKREVGGESVQTFLTSRDMGSVREISIKKFSQYDLVKAGLIIAGNEILLNILSEKSMKFLTEHYERVPARMVIIGATTRDENDQPSTILEVEATFFKDSP